MRAAIPFPPIPRPSVRTLKQHVLRALIESSLVSGQHLAAANGVSRMAISKAVASLRREGFDIESHAGMGYGLRALAPTLTEAEVGARTTSEWWDEIGGAPEVASTNDVVLDAGRRGAEGPLAFVAATQSAGRGRLGRTWESERGGAYVSLLVRPRTQTLDVSTLSLVSALAVARALESFDVPVSVKWPNDVFAGEGKIAGILLESHSSLDGLEYVAIGVGINVATPSLASASSVGHYASEANAAQVVARFLDDFAALYPTWRSSGFAPFRAEFARLDRNVGQPVTVRNRGGEVVESGRCIGVDERGRLLLEQENGVLVPVVSGEVTTRSTLR